MLPLHQRQVDSVSEFEAASVERLRDAHVLHKRSRDLAAVYFYGYSVEMRVKAAYFRSAGFTAVTPITKADRDHATALFATLGLPSRPGQHDISGWTNLAVAARVTTPAAYPISFGTEMVNRATEVYLIWRETLRYGRPRR